MPDVLICDRDSDFAKWLGEYLEECAYGVEIADVGTKGVQRLLSDPVGVVVLGVKPDDTEGLEMIPVIHQIDQGLPIVAVGSEESLEMERKVRLENVFYYTVQPVDLEEVKEAVGRALTGRGAKHT